MGNASSYSTLTVQNNTSADITVSVTDATTNASNGSGTIAAASSSWYSVSNTTGCNIVVTQGALTKTKLLASVPQNVTCTVTLVNGALNIA